MINGINGKEHWGKKLTKSYTTEYQMGVAAVDYTIDRSVWGAELIKDLDGDGVKDIIVAAEDGFAFALSGSNGGIIWKYKCLLLSKPNDETGYGDRNFFNVRVQVVDDMDLDGTEDVIALARSENGKQNINVISGRFSGANQDKGTRARGKKVDIDYDETESNCERQILDIESLEGSNSRTISKVATVDDVSGDQKDDILLLFGNAIVAIDSTTGNVSKIYIENNIFEAEFLDSSVQWVDDITGDGNSELLLTLIPYGIMIMDLKREEILWDYLNTGTMEFKLYHDITGDGVEELLIEQPFQDNYDDNKPPWEKSESYRGLYLFDKITGGIIWNYSVPINNISSDGLGYYEIVPDITGDEIKDIIGYSQDTKDYNSTKITMIDGSTGVVRWSKPPTDQIYKNPNLSPQDGLYEKNNLLNRRIKTLTVVEDLSGDGFADIFVGGEECRIYLLNGNNGSLVWEVKNQWEEQGDLGHEVWFDSEVDLSGGFENNDLNYNWESNLDGLLSTEPGFNSKLSVGEHDISLTVEDNMGNWGSDIIAITALPSNQPVFRLRDNQHGKYFANERCNVWLEPCNFDSSKATTTWISDLDGEVGHGQDFQEYLSPGEHTLTVEVIDNEGGMGKSEDSIKILILELRDIRANFGIEEYDWYSIPANKEVSFRTELDYEGDWDNIEYQWSVDDAPIGGTDKLHLAFSEGRHKITLAIRDRATGYEDSCSKTIVAYDDTAPKARLRIVDSYNEWTIEDNNDEFYYTHPCLPTNSPIGFETWADGEYETNELNYTLDLGDGTVVYNNYIEHIYSSTGKFTITTTIRDNYGKSSSTSISINTVAFGEPVPRWSYDFEPWCWLGVQKYFDASAAYDIDGTITSYSWDFGDGNKGSGESTSHKYDDSGTFMVKLTIKDNDNNIVTVERDITVYSPGMPMVDMNVWLSKNQQWLEDASVPYKVNNDDSLTLDVMSRNVISGWEYSYEWYIDDIYQECAQSISPKLPLGNHEIKLEVKDPLGNIESVEYDFIVRSQGGIKVSIVDPHDGGICVGSSIGSKKQVKNIDWLPWSCSVYLIGENNILIAGDGRLTSAIYDENSISSDMNWRYPEDNSDTWIDENQVQILDDLDGDNVKEISCWLGSHDGSHNEIINGMTGLHLNSDNQAPMLNWGQENSNYIYLDYFSQDETYVEDFNSDGVNDAVVFFADHESNKLKFSVIDGNNGGILWGSPELFKNLDDIGEYQQCIPITVIDDQNADGISDIIVGTTRTDSSGADLRIYSGKTGNKLNTIVYEVQELDEDWVKTIPVAKIAQIEDMTGDGQKDIVLIRQVGSAKENYAREKTVLEIIDLNERTCIRSFGTNDAEIVNNDDITGDGLADIILIIDGIAYCLNGGFNVNILSPTTGELNGDTVFLKWDKPELECELEVDGISYGYFKGGETKLKLSSGTHVIKIMASDEFGGTVSDAVIVKVPAVSWPFIINILAITLLVCYVTVRTAVPYIQRKKRKKKVLEEIEKIKENKSKRARKSIHVTTPAHEKGRIPAAGPTPAPYVASTTPKAAMTPMATLTAPRAIPPIAGAESKQPDSEQAAEKKENIKFTIKDSLEERVELYRTALETALSDGEITEDEENLLKWLREKYGITMDEHRMLEVQIIAFNSD